MSRKVLNTIYVRPELERDNFGRLREVKPDFLLATIKDTETNKTEIMIEERPEVKFYVATKPQEFASIYIPKSEVKEIRSRYSDREIELASALGLKNEFFESVRNKNKMFFMREIYRNPQLYMADVDIEDYFKSKFSWEFGEVLRVPIKKGFSDIEVDISNYRGFPHPEISPCVINTINHIDIDSKTIHSVVLRDPTNPGIFEVENNLQKFVEEHLRKDLTDEDKDCKYNFYFVDREEDVISTYFNIIHKTEPDFVGFWNIDFDILTIINRMKKLNMDILNTICHPDIQDKYKYVKYNRDSSTPTFGGEPNSDKKVGHPSRRWNWLEASGKTQFYDQMSLYSNMRKGTTFSSYKLDSIGLNEVKVQKVDYRSSGYNLKTVIKGNFALFLRYAIKDVYVQYKIEKKVDDISKYILFSGNTRLSKGIKISYVIKNSIMDSFWKDGYIIGNTVSYDIKDFIPGAIVSDPQLLLKKGIKVGGKETFVFENVIDLDAASMYPNIMIFGNVAKSTLMGRIYELIRRKENSDKDIHINMNGSEFNSTIQTIDSSILDSLITVFGLPSLEEIISQSKEYTK